MIVSQIHLADEYIDRVALPRADRLSVAGRNFSFRQQDSPGTPACFRIVVR
jgi:hypothetical protein